MEISVGIIFSAFTKETSQTESDVQISRLLQQLDKLRPDSLTAGRGGAAGKSSFSLYQSTRPLTNLCTWRWISKPASSCHWSPDLALAVTSLHWPEPFQDAHKNSATLRPKTLETLCADLLAFWTSPSSTLDAQESTGLRFGQDTQASAGIYGEGHFLHTYHFV